MMDSKRDFNDGNFKSSYGYAVIVVFIFIILFFIFFFSLKCVSLGYLLNNLNKEYQKNKLEFQSVRTDYEQQISLLNLLNRSDDLGMVLPNGRYNYYNNSVEKDGQKF